MNNAQNQAAWRKRQADRLDRMEAALKLLASKYDGKVGVWPDFVRQTVEQALNPPKTPIKDTGDE